MFCQMMGDLHVKIYGLKRDISAQHTTCRNVDIGDSSEIICMHAVSGEGSDTRKLKIVEIKKDVSCS